MKTELTKEEVALMSVVRDEWINHAMSRQGVIDEKAFEDGIEWLYRELLNLPKPKVIYCSSWLSCVLTIGILKKMPANVRDNVSDNIRDNVLANVRDNIRDNVLANVRDNVSDNVRDNVSDNIRDNVRDNVSDNIRDNVWANVSDNIRDNVWDNVSDNVWANVSDNIRDNVWANVLANVWANVRDNVSDIFSDHSSYIGYSNYGWVSFFDYFSRIGALKHPKFDQYLKLTKSGVFECYEYKNVVFAIKPPVKVNRDERGRLHSVSEPAVVFSDSSEYFFIHGVAISWQMWDLLLAGSFTFEDWAREKNEEVKSACLAYIEETRGSEGLFRFISKHLKEVDSYVDKKDEKYLVGTTGGMNIGVYTLFKGDVNGINLAFVRVWCHSTDRMFFLGVNPSHETAKDAIASLYRIPKKLTPHIKSIRRQGERFSTTFTQNGLNVLRKLASEEVSDLVSVSGDVYFNKMEYEY